jgi:aspartyl-tRNA(Asn)/glutamyl-tRNA(Gln) amidotransferase subunit C
MRVKKIAQVARIYLTEEESHIAEEKLNDVYEWIKSIKEINVDGVLPMYNVNEGEYRTVRTIENPEFFSPAVVLANTPKKADDFILVPKVIE